MKFQLPATVLVATLALSSVLGLTSIVQANPPVDNSGTDTPVVDTPVVDTPVVDTPVVDTPVVDDSDIAGTKFSCVPEGNGNVATVGQRPGGQPIPLIVWTKKSSDYFGGAFTPQKRCNIVTPKLNQAVAESGGSLKDVVLMTGKVNGSTVICAVSITDDGCNKSNILFTLKPENAKKAEAILAQIVKISNEGASAGVIRETTTGRVQVNLGDWAKSAMSNGTRKPGSSKL
ncbi:COP23 domain-containing protein [Cronbergia sp. UHCC 0137]|uniref:COP23 domain-containing protein n=1 Tax=Cronbergia sp. UHCC 0137 TaxID=3110239 RepID=UPI002B217E87|nr:COP23 domain-containing protein [Cronbergia sp. UHCC 0137]MEA5618594.1 COP23 domain-containing protein [Cronbergia sp. UHCC 0137]